MRSKVAAPSQLMRYGKSALATTSTSYTTRLVVSVEKDKVLLLTVKRVALAQDFLTSLASTSTSALSQQEAQGGEQSAESTSEATDEGWAMLEAGEQPKAEPILFFDPEMYVSLLYVRCLACATSWMSEWRGE